MNSESTICTMLAYVDACFDLEKNEARAINKAGDSNEAEHKQMKNGIHEAGIDCVPLIIRV